MKRRKIEVVKRPSRREMVANESAGMKALRAYTTALKLGYIIGIPLITVLVVSVI